MKFSKDAQRIIIALYLRKRRQREHLRIIQRDDCPYPDYKKWKNDPIFWQKVLSGQFNIYNEYHNSLEVAKRALWENLRLTVGNS